MEHTHTGSEPVVNGWSNISYALAAIPYVMLGSGPALAAAFGLVVLCAGSWVYHARVNARTLVYDHVGMQLALAGVLSVSLSSIETVGHLWPLVYGVLLSISGFVYMRNGTFSTAWARPWIAIQALIALATLLVIAWQLLFAVVITFALAFATHDEGENTPSEFGPLHGLWHAFTALGFCELALWLLYMVN